MDIWKDMMRSDDFVPSPDLEQYAVMIRNGGARAERGDAEWIEGSLQRIEGLYLARQKVNSNFEFKEWLIENGLDEDRLSHQDRAAAINLGENLRLARMALTETQSRSIRMIWEEWRDRYAAQDQADRLTSAGKTPESPSIAPETPSPEPMQNEPVLPFSHIRSTAASALLIKTPKRYKDSSIVAKFGPEIGVPIATYLGRNTRTIMRVNKALKKPDARTFATFLRNTPGLPQPVNGLGRLGLSTLWPQAPNALIRLVEHGKDETEMFVSAMLAWPTKVAPVLAEWIADGEPKDTNRWHAKKHPELDHSRPAASTPEQIAAWQASVEAINHEGIGKPRHDPSCRAAHHGSIRHHGVDIWPAPQFASYSFDEAWFVTTMWRTIDKPLQRVEPNARTRASWFFKPFQGCLGNLNPAAGEVLAKLLDAQSEHPDATGPDENVCPPYDSVQ